MNRGVVLGGQIQCRNVTTPIKTELRWDDARPRLGTSARGERHHGLDTPLDFRCGKRCPTSEAMADDSNRAIKQQMIQKKAYIGHTVRDPGFRSRRFLFGGLT